MASPAVNYAAGTLTTGAILITGNIRTVSLVAVAADASFALTAGSPTLSGATITLRSGAARDINFFDGVRDITITRISGTLDYLAWFTP